MGGGHIRAERVLVGGRGVRDLVDKGGVVQVLVVLVVQEGELVASCRKQTGACRGEGGGAQRCDAASQHWEGQGNLGSLLSSSRAAGHQARKRPP